MGSCCSSHEPQADNYQYGQNGGQSFGTSPYGTDSPSAPPWMQPQTNPWAPETNETLAKKLVSGAIAKAFENTERMMIAREVVARAIAINLARELARDVAAAAVRRGIELLEAQQQAKAIAAKATARAMELHDQTQNGGAASSSSSGYGLQNQGGSINR